MAQTEGDVISVLIVDDHRVFAEALATALDLEHDIAVVGIAGSVSSAVELFERHRPGVVLLDYQLPDGNGPEACAAILKQAPDTWFVLLTGFAEVSVMMDAVEAGVSAFLAKTSSFAEVAQAVRAASVGETLLGPAMLQSLLRRMQEERVRPAGSDERAPAQARLTARELEVLSLVARGLSNAQVADELVISRHTVRTHVQNALTKLDAHSKLAGVWRAQELGLLRVPTKERWP